MKAALTGAAIVLAIVGVFMTLDRTVLHWYAADPTDPPVATPTPTPVPTATPRPEPTATPAPNFFGTDVGAIVQSQASALPFPGNTRFVICANARYNPGNKTWVVECAYTIEKRDDVLDALLNPDATKTFVFDDETGRLIQ